MSAKIKLLQKAVAQKKASRKKTTNKFKGCYLPK